MQQLKTQGFAVLPRSSQLPPPDYPVASRPAVILLCLLVITWWLELGTRFPIFAATRFEFLLAATTALVAILNQARRPKHFGCPEWGKGTRGIVVSAVVLQVVLLINVPFSIVPAIAWNAFVNKVLKLAVIGALIPSIVVSPSALRAYLLAHLLAFLKIGQEGFLGKITGSMVWENQGIPRLNGPQLSTYGSPNSYSGRLVSSIPFLWYLHSCASSKAVRWAIVLMGAFALNIIIFAGSRTGYVALLFTVLLFVAFDKRNRGKIFAALLVACVVAVIAVPQAYKDRFESAFTGQEAEGRSSETRKGLFVDSLRAFTDHPLGVGLQNFSVYQYVNGRNAQPTHNLYTELLAESGFQGFIAFFVFVIFVLRKAHEIRRKAAALLDRLSGASDAPAEDLRSVRLIHRTATAVVVYIYLRLCLGVFGHDVLEIYWWFAAGLTMALANLMSVASARAAPLQDETMRKQGKDFPR